MSDRSLSILAAALFIICTALATIYWTQSRWDSAFVFTVLAVVNGFNLYLSRSY